MIFPDEDKSAALLAAEYRHIDGPIIMRTHYWDQLPEDLRLQFEKGNILVTTNNHLNSGKSDIEEKKTKNGDYALLTLGNKNNGRTGVLMQTTDGETKPILVEIEGREYIIELKGCGTNQGGYGDTQFRTGRHIISGAVEKEQAINEVNMLNREQRIDAPKAAGAILFTGKDNYQQGYIIRLSPSTVRASYTNNDCYPDIESPEQVQAIISMHSTCLTDQLFCEHPKLMDRGAYPENILVWGDGNFMYTDFSDQLSLSDFQHPHVGTSQGTYHPETYPEMVLQRYIEMVEEIPGYTSEQNRTYFYQTLAQSFQLYGVNLGIKNDDSYKIITKKIWEKAMANQVFQSRKSSHYTPEGILNGYKEHIFNNPFIFRELGLGDKAKFVATFKMRFLLFEYLMGVMDRGNLPISKFPIEDCLQQFHQGNLLGALEKFKVIQYNSNDIFSQFTKEDQRRFGIVLDYFGAFYANFIGTVERYLQHEQSVVAHAKQRLNPDDNLEQMRDVIEGRMRQFESLFREDIGVLYDTISDISKIKDIITFDFYQK